MRILKNDLKKLRVVNKEKQTNCMLKRNMFDVLLKTFVIKR